jgi:hypothetical protein
VLFGGFWGSNDAGTRGHDAGAGQHCCHHGVGQWGAGTAAAGRLGGSVSRLVF